MVIVASNKLWQSKQSQYLWSFLKLAFLHLGSFPILRASLKIWYFVWKLVIFPYSLVFHHFTCLCYFELLVKKKFNKYIIRDCHNEIFSAVYSQTQAVFEWVNNSNYGWVLYGYCNCLQTQRYAELWVNLRNLVMLKYKNMIKMPKSLYLCFTLRTYSICLLVM